MKYLFLLLSLVVALLSLPSVVEAATYYVGPDGNGDGSNANPWSLNQANSQAQAGDVVILKNGMYVNQQIRPENSGREGQPIVFKAENSRQAKLQGPGGPLVLIDAKDFITIEGLVLDVGKKIVSEDRDAILNGTHTNENRNLVGIRVEYGSNDIMIRDVEVMNGFYGIFLNAINATALNKQPIERVEIHDSDIHDNYSFCVVGWGNVHYLRIENNKIHDCKNKWAFPVTASEGLHTAGFGIELGSVYGAPDGNGSQYAWIIGNEIYGNAIQGIRTWHADHVLIKDNYIHNNGATGYQAEHTTTNAYVVGNVFEDNARTYWWEGGLWLVGENITATDNVIRGNMMGVLISGIKNNASWNDPGALIASKHLILRNNLVVENKQAVLTQPVPAGAPVGSLTGAAIAAKGLNGAEFSDSTIYNNTFFANGHANSNAANVFIWSNRPDGSAPYYNQNVWFVNNIVGTSAADAASGNTNQTQIALHEHARQLQARSNWYFHPGVSQPFQLNFVRADFATWQSWGFDTGSVWQTDPQLATDYSLQANSPAIDAGQYLTQTTNVGTNSRQLQVENPHFFSDGYGLIAGDTIAIGTKTRRAVIETVNYETKTLTLTEAANWQTGDWVSLAFAGEKPDVGAKEYGMEQVPPVEPAAHTWVNVLEWISTWSQGIRAGLVR